MMTESPIQPTKSVSRIREMLSLQRIVFALLVVLILMVIFHHPLLKWFAGRLVYDEAHPEQPYLCVLGGDRRCGRGGDGVLGSVPHELADRSGD